MKFIGRVLLALALLAGCSVGAAAAGQGSPVQRHRLRIGWGDMLFETAVYYPTVQHVFDTPSAIPDYFRTKEDFSHWFTGHIFAEYQYSVLDFLSVGGQIDFESMGWKSGWFDNNHVMVEALPDVRFSNVVVMPTVRLSYLRKEPVSVYSGLGAGLLLSFAQTVEAAPAVYINLVGVQLGSGHWSGSLDLGAMASMSDFSKVYLMGSRLVSVSINYSW